MNKTKIKSQSIVGYGSNRMKHDFYPTPSSTTEALMKRESFDGIIWECASGEGDMSKVLEKYNKIISTDLRKDKNIYGRKKFDFLNHKPDFEFQNIITNPPYKYAKEFIKTALLFPNTKKVAMLLKLVFLEGITRYDFFKETPLKKVYVFCRRQPIKCQSYKGNNSSMIAYAWFVWDKDYKGNPQIEWIPE